MPLPPIALPPPLAFVLGLAVAAAAGPGAAAKSSKPGQGHEKPAVVAPPPDPTSAYVLTEKERGYDCRKLTGRIQLRVMQIRGTPATPSAAARSLQSASTPVFGGTYRGIDPAVDNAADRKQLEAYNARLVEKGCPSFDLPAALAAPSNGPPPRATVPARAKPAPAVAPPARGPAAK
jgi:hypothetical protein